MLAQIQMFSKLANSMSEKRIIHSYITDIFSKIANPITSHPALLDCDRDYFTKLANIDKKQTLYRFVREKFIHYREIVRNRSLFHYRNFLFQRIIQPIVQFMTKNLSKIDNDDGNDE